MSDECPLCKGSGTYKVDQNNIREWLSAVKKREADETKAYYNRPDIKAQVEENNRRSGLPPEDPDHICGMRCDGQDGQSSDCYKIRMKLFGKWHNH